MIRLDRISKYFGEVHAVSDISFTVDHHQALALVGPSGSGKSTVLRLIAGLEIPDAGRIIIDGEVVSRPGSLTPPHTRGIGMVFQRPALWPHLTVAQHIAFGLSEQSNPEVHSRVKTLVHLTRLEGLEKRHPYELSGGEAQRVALARALAPEPRILLLDEPLSNLDSELHSEMLRLITKVRSDTEVTLILVSHNQTEATSFCDRVITLRAGRVLPGNTPGQKGSAQPSGTPSEEFPE